MSVSCFSLCETNSLIEHRIKIPLLVTYNAVTTLCTSAERWHGGWTEEERINELDRLSPSPSVVKRMSHACHHSAGSSRHHAYRLSVNSASILQLNF